MMSQSFFCSAKLNGCEKLNRNWATISATINLKRVGVSKKIQLLFVLLYWYSPLRYLLVYCVLLGI